MKADKGRLVGGYKGKNETRKEKTVWGKEYRENQRLLTSL